MAVIIVLFLLGHLLLVSTMVAAIEEEIVTEHYHAMSPSHSPRKAPVHSPEKPHHHLPKRARTHSPEKAPAAHSPEKAPAATHSPKKSHVHPPANAPFHPPINAPIFSHKHECVPKCEGYCKTQLNKRPCMKSCTACCAKCTCVPAGPKKCNNWDHVMMHGVLVKCP